MRKIFTLTFILYSLIVFSQDKKNFKVYWKNGLHFESADNYYKIKLGGRIQYDVMFIQQDDSLNAYFTGKNGAEIRRARFYTSGTIYKNIKFKLQMDFALSRAVFKDVYIQLTKIPYIGNIRVGQFKEPFGLEMITSSNFITFMERPLTNQFDIDRSLGTMIYNNFFNKRLAIYAGYFVPSLNIGRYIGNRNHVTFRVTGLPIYNTEGSYQVFHLGVGYSNQYYANKEIIYKTRPEAHLAPKYISLQIDKLKRLNSFKGEIAYVYKSFYIEGEYTMNNFNPSDNSVYLHDSYLVYAYFVNVSWFITGEHKNYNPSKSAFDRVTPKKNFSNGGVGAFEIALRYSSINLNKHDLVGGEMSDITFGLNWYLNPATKFAFNYVHTDIVNLGKANIFQFRFQVTF
jgi:phosphate-selective porin OprO/OprP